MLHQILHYKVSTFLRKFGNNSSTRTGTHDGTEYSTTQPRIPPKAKDKQY